MTINIPAGKSFVIRLEQIDGSGSPWIVRLLKKGLLRRQLISSDWFLDEKQAKKFADQLKRELGQDGASVESVRSREPGWTLHRAPR